MGRWHAGVVQWQNTSLPSWLSRVRIPSPALLRLLAFQASPERARRSGQVLHRFVRGAGRKRQGSGTHERRNGRVESRSLFREHGVDVKRVRSRVAGRLKIPRHFFGGRGKNRDFEGENFLSFGCRSS